MDAPKIDSFPDPMQKMMKSPEQGAATTVWAAIGKEWEGKGGKYLEECSISKPVDPEKTDLTPMDPGYKPYAYDIDAAKRLWDLSNKLVVFTEWSNCQYEFPVLFSLGRQNPFIQHTS